MVYFRKLQANAMDALKPDAPTIVGLECRNCSASHVCTTLQNASLAAVDMAGDNVPFNLSDKALAKELEITHHAITLMKARAAGIEAEVLARIKGGINVPGWRTEQGMGRERWKVPLDQVIAMGILSGVDVSKPGAITPKQAIKKGLSEAMVHQFSETPYGEVKLVEDDLSRSRKVFG